MLWKEREIPAPADEEQEDPRVTFKVERYVPDNLPQQYSDSMTVLHTENEFIVSFYLTEHPAAATKEELEEVKSLKSRCVARVIMSPGRIAGVIDALQQNFDKYSVAYAKTESE